MAAKLYILSRRLDEASLRVVSSDGGRRSYLKLELMKHHFILILENIPYKVKRNL